MPTTGRKERAGPATGSRKSVPSSACAADHAPASPAPPRQIANEPSEKSERTAAAMLTVSPALP
ncbi:hypothetical protein GCM10022287_37470 [Gryllotalpicola koreensis]|uniref:Uncharacterized protein n=1 Tax=Gryllotalpicola koreensis TaxID=993086 RepID=A0ABP8ACW9_9MICO